MAGINKAILVGYLGNDPDMRKLDGGRSVVNFSLGTTRKWTTDGETKEDTQWHRIVVWGKQAENCKEYLSKGSMVYLEGYIQNRKYEDKEGVTKYTTEIVANLVQFLDRKGSGGKSSGGDEPPPPPGNDDIPF